MRLLFTLIVSLMLTNLTIANDRYEKAMKKNLDRMDDCVTVNDFINLANTFERIALAEGDKWLPYYYTSMLYVLASFQDSTSSQKDIYLDEADEFITAADSLEPNNSEIYTMKGMIAQARMQVDPMNRWQKYGAAADNNFKKAVEIDSLNPRPEYLIGIGVYYTPAQFGGGPANAKPILENSKRKFEEFKPESELMPKWGEENVDQLLQQIAEAETKQDSLNTN